MAREHAKALNQSLLDTPIGSMLAIASNDALYVLDFVERRYLMSEIEWLNKKLKIEVTAGRNKIIDSIEKELQQYFAGELKKFKTPLFLLGSPFQKSVWQSLMKIPYGKIQSYSELATAVGKPKAFRAVANANGANLISIVIPCHRVINSNGNLGGYAGGVSRKEWLLNHEKKL